MHCKHFEDPRYCTDCIMDSGPKKENPGLYIDGRFHFLSDLPRFVTKYSKKQFHTGRELLEIISRNHKIHLYEFQGNRRSG